MAASALMELELVIELFEKGAPSSLRARQALVRIQIFYIDRTHHLNDFHSLSFAS